MRPAPRCVLPQPCLRATPAPPPHPGCPRCGPFDLRGRHWTEDWGPSVNWRGPWCCTDICGHAPWPSRGGPAPSRDSCVPFCGRKVRLSAAGRAQFPRPHRGGAGTCPVTCCIWLDEGTLRGKIPHVSVPWSLHPPCVSQRPQWALGSRVLGRTLHSGPLGREDGLGKRLWCAMLAGFFAWKAGKTLIWCLSSHGRSPGFSPEGHVHERVADVVHSGAEGGRPRGFVWPGPGALTRAANRWPPGTAG